MLCAAIFFNAQRSNILFLCRPTFYGNWELQEALIPLWKFKVKEGILWKLKNALFRHFIVFSSPKRHIIKNITFSLKNIIFIKCLSELAIFKNRRLEFLHFSVYKLLPAPLKQVYIFFSLISIVVKCLLWQAIFIKTNRQHFVFLYVHFTKVPRGILSWL